MKSIAFYLLVPVFLLSSCGQPDNESLETLPSEKQSFFIETETVGSSRESYEVEKSARITAGSTLTLTAESLGEISSISVKEGTKIKKGMKLIALRDTVNSYDLRVAQAKNALDIQDASRESTKLSLDKAVTDTEIAYENAKRAYETLLSKTNLSYDTIVNANQKTFDTLDANYKIYLAEIEKNMDQILYQSDQILGLSPLFENTNNNFEAQLGARVGSLKVASDNSWGTAMSLLADVRARKSRMTTADTAQSDIELIEKAYAAMIKHIDDMIYMLQNNVISGSLSQEQNNTWLTLYAGYRSSVNGTNTGFTAWKNTILTFLKNYKLNEIATKVAIESLDRDLTKEELALIEKSADAKLLYYNTIIDLKDKISALKLAVEQAKNAKETALKNRDTTLSQLGFSRTSSALSLEQIEREYAKLSIIAPFDGSVARVIGTLGQRVSIGTPLIEVVSNLPEVVLDLDATIIDGLTLGDEVSVLVGDKSLSGTISAISRVAGNNLLYTTRISVPAANLYIGTAAKVILRPSRDVEADTSLGIVLPLRSVKIISEQEGEIHLLDKNNSIVSKSVRLGRVSGDMVIIDDILERGTEIILSDIANFDPDKFILTKKHP